MAGERAAAEKIKTEYGFQLPNGKVLWGDYKRGEYGHNAETVWRNNDARQKWHTDLREIADRLDLDPDWFVKQHKIVKRDIITTTTDPVEATPTLFVPPTD